MLSRLISTIVIAVISISFSFASSTDNEGSEYLQGMEKICSLKINNIRVDDGLIYGINGVKVYQINPETKETTAKLTLPIVGTPKSFAISGNEIFWVTDKKKLYFSKNLCETYSEISHSDLGKIEGYTSCQFLNIYQSELNPNILTLLELVEQTDGNHIRIAIRYSTDFGKTWTVHLGSEIQIYPVDDFYTLLQNPYNPGIMSWNYRFDLAQYSIGTSDWGINIFQKKESNSSFLPVQAFYNKGDNEAIACSNSLLLKSSDGGCTWNPYEALNDALNEVGKYENITLCGVNKDFTKLCALVWRKETDSTGNSCFSISLAEADMKKMEIKETKKYLSFYGMPTPGWSKVFNGKIYFYATDENNKPSIYSIPAPEELGIEEVSEPDEGMEKDMRMYDLMGRRIENPARGTIYIQGGKKFVAK